tara:strand:+ start:11473 stop:12312 length:840 start_codon:yes stop_codon:yes gene_type:complete
MSDLALKEDGLTIEEMAAALGAANNNKDRAPSVGALKINSFGEDANGDQIPLGSFFLNNQNPRVYAKEGVRFRAFTNHIQYQHWDDGKLLNKSLLVLNQKAQARDQLGGEMCGMPTYEQSISMSPKEREEYLGRDRYRIIRGVVSYTGTTATGEEVTIENEPCVLSLKRKNYGPFYHDVTNRMPKGISNLWDFESILKADKCKTDKGAVYYVMRFTPQFDNLLEVDQMVSDTIKHTFGLVASENKRIDEAYKNASMQAQDEAYQDEIMDQVNTLEHDFV